MRRLAESMMTADARGRAQGAGGGAGEVSPSASPSLLPAVTSGNRDEGGRAGTPSRSRKRPIPAARRKPQAPPRLLVSEPVLPAAPARQPAHRSGVRRRVHPHPAALPISGQADRYESARACQGHLREWMRSHARFQLQEAETIADQP